MIKYPKTPRLPNADVLGWKNLHAVVSEKLDGANVGVSFESRHDMTLQSRGHILRGGRQERQFDLFKGMMHPLQDRLWEALGDDFVLFGEWLYAKHRVFYDALPSYLFVLDVYDKRTECFLSKPRRRNRLQDLPLPEPPTLYEGSYKKVSNFTQFIGTSPFRSENWRTHLVEDSRVLEIRDPLDHTDDSRLMEGVYVKVEDENSVVGRLKISRPEFEKVRDSDLWKKGRVLPNRCVV